jgi:hypothetical protein
MKRIKEINKERKWMKDKDTKEMIFPNRQNIHMC